VISVRLSQARRFSFGRAPASVQPGILCAKGSLLDDSKPNTRVSSSCAHVLGVPVTHRDLEAAAAGIEACASSGRGGYVCLANVHMIMEALDDASFFDILDHAQAVVPDGMPLVWSLRADGYRDTERIAGMDLTAAVLALAEEGGFTVGFYGGRPQVLARLLTCVRSRWPGVRIAYAYSPPFRSLGESKVEEQIEDINRAGVQILFVGLGCPKQERWMATNRAYTPAVMLGVGAVFDVLSGHKPQAPALVRRLGLEWLLRLVLEPRRLFWRYVRHNPRFVWRSIAARVGKRVSRS
jgi:N-acetylglucosaminyldiphosphoundecaprenol N-acetyl-beta-D-mannosaminyltransferase